MKCAKILIVEDESILALGMKKTLEDMGHEVVKTVHSGEKAIIATEMYLPDIIFMDISLKGNMNGIEAAKVIQSKSNIPIIYLSAYNEEEVINKSNINKNFSYLVKPYLLEELKLEVQNALQKCIIK